MNVQIQIDDQGIRVFVHPVTELERMAVREMGGELTLRRVNGSIVIEGAAESTPVDPRLPAR